MGGTGKGIKTGSQIIDMKKSIPVRINFRKRQSMITGDAEPNLYAKHTYDNTDLATSIIGGKEIVTMRYYRSQPMTRKPDYEEE